LLIVLFAGFSLFFTAEESQSVSASEYDRNITFYAGVNPWAIFAFLPNPIGTAATAFGIASNQEFGVALYGGMIFSFSHSLEMRFSTGPANAAIWDTQLQFGYIWYPLGQFMNYDGGLSVGFMLRLFFWNNRITEYVTFNLTPKLLAGWRFRTQSLAFDVRGGLNFASVTWSDMSHTKSAAGWTPFPFNLTLTTGIAWVFEYFKM
jgi:hypothetical protein